MLAAMNAMTHPTETDLAARRWAQVTSRDAAADGQFIYAVRTTGVYCRPSCKSRPARRENVEFFDTTLAAQAAGYRACKRCKPDQTVAPVAGSAAVAKALTAIRAHVAAGNEGPPLLADLAEAAGMSPTHLQRRFTALVGVSPRAFADQLRLGRFKRALKSGNGVADALYDAGYGSSSRVYERSDARLGMTPATFAKGGQGVTLTYAIADCRLGRLLIAASARGIAAVEFGDDDDVLIAELQGDFPAAKIITDEDGGLAQAVAGLIAHLDRGQPCPSLTLDIQATAFQAKVWDALTKIPPGETRTYGELADQIGAPGAARAVGTACGANRLAVLIPCHRALRRGGALGGYRWGLERKQALLASERAGRES